MLKKLPLFIFLFLFLLRNEAFAVNLKINEIFVHPSSGNEWVEFYNPESIDLTTYFLDDDIDFNNDSGTGSKKALTNIDNSNLLFPFFECSSFLNNNGDNVVLFSPDGQIIDQYEYIKDPGEEVSMGRFPDGLGEIAILASSTKGVENSSLPTSTPTNTQAPTPSNTSTPTPKPSPTPTKTPTPAPTKTPTPTENTTTTSNNLALALTNTPTQKLASNSALVLGEKTLRLSTLSSVITPVKKEDKEKQEISNLPAFIFIFTGIIFITTCAILGFLFYKKKKIKKL